MNWEKNRVRSNWREFSFVYNQVKRIIDPELALNKMIRNWKQISILLSEGNRKRKPQLSHTFLDITVNKTT